MESITNAVQQSSKHAPDDADQPSIIDVAQHAVNNDGHPRESWERLTTGEIPEGLEVVADRLDIEEEPGTVLVSSSNNGREIYHTDPDCHCFRSEPVEKPLSVLHDDLRECKYCSGEFEGNGQDIGKQPEDLIQGLGENDGE